MSFILDALRKSEHARQQERGPALAEVPVAAARPRSNVWATGAVVLLLVNLVAVGILLLRRAGHDVPQPQAASPAAAPQTNVPAMPTAAPQTPATAAPAPQASITQTLPQPTLRAPEPAPAVPYPTSRNPLEREISGGVPPEVDAGMAAQAAAVPEGPPAVRRTTEAAPHAQRGSVVYETLPEAAAAAAADEPPADATAAPPGLPTADDMKARGGLPDLHLDLHVYSAKPQDRFIFVNGHRYRERDTLQEGPVVEQITRQGAVLEYRGTRFLLTND